MGDRRGVDMLVGATAPTILAEEVDGSILVIKGQHVAIADMP